MSQARYYERNAGPLKLEHDQPTQSYQPTTILAHRQPIYYQTDFRYKGYPAQSFLSPRVPVNQLIQEVRESYGGYNEASPRDFKITPNSRPAPVLIRSDARYKGYPGNSFHSPRIPVSQSPDHFKENKPLGDFYGKLTLFEPGKPKLDEGHRGLQYGSGNIHVPPPAPKPTQYPTSIRAVPFGENKTPAELDRRRELQREAEADIERHKNEQLRRKEREMAEKKKDFDQLKYHFMLDPHKYGHGAPRGDGDHKRRKFTEQDMTSSTSPRYRDSTYGIPNRQLTKPLDYDIRGDENHQPDFFMGQSDRSRNDAPGNNNVRGDKTIRFQDEVRYNRPQQEELRKDLDRQKEDMELLKQREKIRELRQELEMLRSDEKVQNGGGAPNRSSSGRHLLLRKTIHLSHDPAELDRINKRDELWQPQERAKELKSLEFDRSQGGAGAPILDSGGRKVTRHPITMNRTELGESSIREEVPGRRRRVWAPDEEEYNAFGRPGAGAPIRDKDGRIVTAILGNINRDGVVQLTSADRRTRTLAAKHYRNDLQKEMEEQKRMKKETEDYVKAPVGELASIMLEGKVGRPRRDRETGTIVKASLGTTDVSRIKMNKPEDQNRGDMQQYYNDLTAQAQERYQTEKLDKLREGREWRQHNDTFWFAPERKRYGGGAPKANYLKKERLSNLLYSPRRDEFGNLILEQKATSDLSQAPSWMQGSPREPVDQQEKSYQSDNNEQYSSSNVGQRYVKSTISSGSRNMYQLPQDGPSNPYSMQAPFALGNY